MYNNENWKEFDLSDWSKGCYTELATHCSWRFYQAAAAAYARLRLRFRNDQKDWQMYTIDRLRWQRKVQMAVGDEHS